MRRATLLLGLLVLALGCSGPEGPGPRAHLERAVEAVGGAPAIRSIASLGIRWRGTLHPPAGLGAETPISGEWLLRVPDGLATGQTTAGLLTRKAVTEDSGWLRQGAAVRDLDRDETAAEKADRDDLLAALALPLLEPEFRVERAEDEAGRPAVRVIREGGAPFLLELDPESGLPARIRRRPEGAGAEGELVRTFSGWSSHGGILFPGRIETAVAGGRQVIEVTELTVNPETPGPVFDRPDDTGPGVAGEIRRETLPPSRVVAVANRGRLTELASIDLFYERALDAARVRRQGPIVRIFHRFPGEDGRAEVVTMAVVEFPAGAKSPGFPGGFRDEPVPETRFLVMPYTGPYPTDDSVYEPLRRRAAELGLVEVGPPWHAILSDPDAGEPDELEQEIRLPVAEKEKK